MGDGKVARRRKTRYGQRGGDGPNTGKRSKTYTAETPFGRIQNRNFKGNEWLLVLQDEHGILVTHYADRGTAEIHLAHALRRLGYTDGGVYHGTAQGV